MTEVKIITERKAGFICRVSKSGDHYHFTIPKHLIDLDIIIPGSKYYLFIEKLIKGDVKK